MTRQARGQPGTAAAAAAAPARGMTRVPGGTFWMGSDLPGYPEEGPPHQVSVDGFWVDENPVTVTQFRRFVKATGYVTVAERPLDPRPVPRCRPGPAGARLAGVRPHPWPRGPVGLEDMVAVCARR